MAASGYEIRPRRFSADSVVLNYHVIDAPNIADVFAWVALQSATVAGLPYSTFQADEIEDCENADEYFVAITYGASDNPTSDEEPGTSGYRFSFQAPSAHIKRSLATISATEDPAIFAFGAPPMHGAINVVDYGTADVHTEGFDLQPPAEVFTIPYTDVDAVIDAAYQAVVRNLCGKVNNATFLGHLAGQIMLVRADGQRQNGLWNLDFGFGYVANATNIPVGDNIVVAAKDGLDLLWVLDITGKDDTAKSLISQPACAYVERVWERADLNDLNLP